MARHAWFVLSLVGALSLVPAFADDQYKTPVPSQDEMRVMTENRLDSKRLERELQHLSWGQFRSVIEAIPKLKADVDAYGPAGWQYVHGRYQSYAWRRNIDKLTDDDKQKLAALIDQAEERR